MSRNGSARLRPLCTTRTRPGCATTESFPGAPGAAVTCVGWSRPRATTTGPAAGAPPAAGTRSRAARTSATALTREQDTAELVFFPRLENRKHLISGAKGRLFVGNLELAVALDR